MVEVLQRVQAEWLLCFVFCYKVAFTRVAL